jgi:hypothetical protein
MFLEHMREMAGILAVAGVASEVTNYVDNVDRLNLGQQARDTGLTPPPSAGPNIA